MALKRGITDEKLTSFADYATSDLYINQAKVAHVYAEMVTYSD